MQSAERTMQTFRSNTTKMEPLCFPPPPPPPPLPRPSYMPPPPPPLALAMKRFESPGSRGGGRPVQNRFAKSPDQCHFQRPALLPFLPPPPPPHLRAQVHRRHSSPPPTQYRSVSQAGHLQRKNREVKEHNAATFSSPAQEEQCDVTLAALKKETKLSHSIAQDKTENKPSSVAETDTCDNKTNRKRPAEKELFISRVTGTSFAGLPKELTQKFAPLKCELCSVSVNSPVQAKMHYSGKQHEKKVYSFLLNWSMETGEPMPKQLRESTSKKQSSPEVSFCEVCNVVLTSSAHAEQHYMGRNHRRVAAGLASAKAKTEQGILPADDPTGRFGIGSQFQVVANPDPLGLMSEEPSSSSVKTKKFFCELCKVAATSKDQLDIHFRGAKHRKAEAASRTRSAATGAASPAAQSDSILASVIQNDDGTQKVVGKDYSIYRTPSGYYYCQPCNLTLNSEAQFIQHCESKKHKFKTATAKKPSSSVVSLA